MSIKECQYCETKFLNEASFLKHHCEKRKRHEFIKTAKGVALFSYYKEWLRISNGNITNDPTTFINSRYYTCFVNFNEYSNKMMLPNKNAFIRYMSTKNILPNNWCNDDVYLDYINNIDNAYTPSEQLDETVKTLYELSSIFGCTVSDVFNYLEAGDCFKLLKARRLTPWVLLFSRKFHQYISIKLSKEQRIIIQNVINPQLWEIKFKNRPADVEKMKLIVKELNL